MEIYDHYSQLCEAQELQRSLNVPMNSTTPYTDITQTRKARDDKIKRPMNAFMYYGHIARKKLSNENPTEKNHSEISKVLGRKWSSLPEPVKAIYKDISAKLKILHRIEYPDYKYQPKKRTKDKLKGVTPSTGGRVSKARRTRKTCETLIKIENIPEESTGMPIQQDFPLNSYEANANYNHAHYDSSALVQSDNIPQHVQANNAISECIMPESPSNSRGPFDDHQTPGGIFNYAPVTSFHSQISEPSSQVPEDIFADNFLMQTPDTPPSVSSLSSEPNDISDLNLIDPDTIADAFCDKILISDNENNLITNINCDTFMYSDFSIS